MKHVSGRNIFVTPSAEPILCLGFETRRDELLREHCGSDGRIAVDVHGCGNSGYNRRGLVNSACGFAVTCSECLRLGFVEMRAIGTLANFQRHPSSIRSHLLKVTAPECFPYQSGRQATAATPSARPGPGQGRSIAFQLRPASPDLKRPRLLAA